MTVCCRRQQAASFKQRWPSAAKQGRRHPTERLHQPRGAARLAACMTRGEAASSCAASGARRVTAAVDRHGGDGAASGGAYARRQLASCRRYTFFSISICGGSLRDTAFLCRGMATDLPASGVVLAAGPTSSVHTDDAMSFSAMCSCIRCYYSCDSLLFMRFTTASWDPLLFVQFHIYFDAKIVMARTHTESIVHFNFSE